MIVALCVLILWILWPILSETFYGHFESEREVRDFVGRLRIGATREAVDRSISASGYRKLIVRQRGVTEWHIGTPGTLGVSDWTVTLRFGDAGLACATVGTADDWSRAPARAPAAPCVR
jgi:hypothetical protein